MEAPAAPSTLIESWAPISIILHFAIAGAVTIHALINKRDVPAAIGWIGLAWLSPFFGALLYAGFGVNRVKRRARQLREATPRRLRPKTGDSSSHAPAKQFERTIGTITGQEIEAGNIIVPLRCGDEAYPQMLAAIDQSGASVALTSYIFRVDEIGEKFIEALVRAHRRGVVVRVLIDGFGGGFLRSPAYRHLRKHGVPAARFSHSILPWEMPFLDLRLHKKVLVVDGVTAFVGGLNIGAENLSETRPKAPVIDIHFRVEGPVVRQLLDDFEEDWRFTTRETVKGPAVPVAKRAGGQVLARAIAAGPDQEVDQLVLVLLSAINSAEKSIKIATPYFLPDEQLITALQLAALRGVEVDLVLPAKNNHLLIAWAARAHVGPLLDAGCRLWRCPPPFDHSKLMTVDDEWCLIGSPNWDTRSLRLNFELAVEAYDSDLALQLATIIDRKCVDPLTSTEFVNRLFIVKLRDAAARLLMPYL
jgi:cardiolipin synthase A/B